MEKRDYVEEIKEGDDEEKIKEEEKRRRTRDGVDRENRKRNQIEKVK